MSEYLQPDLRTLSLLASAITHAEEATNPAHSHPVDMDTLRTTLNNPTLRRWMAQMTDSGLSSLPRRGNHWKEARDE